MARSHKVWLSKLASLAFKLNSELDKGSFIPMEEACKAIATRTGVVAFITEFLHLGNSTISYIDAEDDITISEYFDNVSGGLCPEELGVHKNGICWLLGLTIEMMQQQNWTTFDNPTDQDNQS